MSRLAVCAFVRLRFIDCTIEADGDRVTANAAVVETNVHR